MDLAKVSSMRQITIPIDICNLLKIKPGNKILFVKRKNGEVIISNASIDAISEAQESFRGVADKLNIKTDDDVMKLVREVRYGEK